MPSGSPFETCRGAADYTPSLLSAAPPLRIITILFHCRSTDASIPVVLLLVRCKFGALPFSDKFLRTLRMAPGALSLQATMRSGCPRTLFFLLRSGIYSPLSTLSSCSSQTPHSPLLRAGAPPPPLLSPALFSSPARFCASYK